MFKIEKNKQSSFVTNKKIIKYKRNFSRQGIMTWRSNADTDSMIEGYISGDYVYGYVFHKIRRKTKVTKVRNNKPNMCFYKRKKISDSGWEVTTHRFPISRVKYFKQFKNHFNVVLF